MSNVKKENPKLSHWGSKKKKIRVKELEDGVKVFKLNQDEMNAYLKNIDSREVPRRK